MKKTISIEELAEEGPSEKSISVEELVSEEVKIKAVKHDWPHMMGPNMNGFTDLGGNGDYMVVFASEDGNVYAYSLDGKSMWSTQCDGGFTNLSKDYTPAVVDDRIYVTTKDEKLIALDFNGNIELIKKLNVSQPPTSPVIKGKHVLIGSFNDLFAHDLEGNELWKKRAVGSWSIPPVLLDDFILSVSSPAYQRLNASTYDGELKWSFEDIGGMYIMCPVVDKDTIYLSSSDKGLSALDLEKKVKWEFKLEDVRLSAPAVCKDLLVMNFEGHERKGGVVCIDKYGKQKWIDKIRGIESSHNDNPPVIYGNQVLVPGYTRIFGYDLYSGKRLWAGYVAGGDVGPPAVIDDFAVMSNGYGRIVAINPNRINHITKMTKNPLRLWWEHAMSKSGKYPRELWRFNQWGETVETHFIQSNPVIIRK